MFSFPCFPLLGVLLYILYTLGLPKVPFGGLIYNLHLSIKKMLYVIFFL